VDFASVTTGKFYQLIASKYRAGNLHCDRYGCLVWEERCDLSTFRSQSRLVEFVRTLISSIIQAKVTALNLDLRHPGMQI